MPKPMLKLARTLLAGWLAGLGIAGLVTPALAAPAAARSCHEAAQDAERSWGLPAGLLEAIGHIESGRFDAASGQVAAWPFSINAAGQGRYFATADAAIDAVRTLQAQGVASIDVGCFQINLLYHPDAFASLEAAFDPDANAEAAAQFLSALHGRAGDWEAAVALYHSAVPERGLPYQQMVLADWHGERVSSGFGGFGGFALPGAPRRAAADPFVVLIAARAAAVAVYGPNSDAAPAVPSRAAPVPSGRRPALRPMMLQSVVLRVPGFRPATATGHAAGLPRVFTPTGPG